MSEFPPRSFMEYDDLRSQLEEAKRERDYAVNSAETLQKMLAEVQAQLEAAKRERDDARKDLTAMQGLFDTATEANLHARSKLSFLATYAAGMREALEYVKSSMGRAVDDSQNLYNAVMIASKALSTPATDFEKRMQGLVDDFKRVRPDCDECGEPGVVQYDSQGEGYYWLCERTDGDHDEDHYCGVEIYRLKALAAWEGK